MAWLRFWDSIIVLMKIDVVFLSGLFIQSIMKIDVVFLSGLFIQSIIVVSQICFMWEEREEAGDEIVWYYRGVV